MQRDIAQNGLLQFSFMSFEIYILRVCWALATFCCLTALFIARLPDRRTLQIEIEIWLKRNYQKERKRLNCCPSKVAHAKNEADAKQQTIKYRVNAIVRHFCY